MNTALLTLALTVAAPQELTDETRPASEELAHEAPLAPRAPGITAFWVGGGLFGVSAELTLVGACIACGVVDLRLQTLAFSTVGLVSMLGGMMWMVWRQPDDEPISKTPGFSAASIGLVQILAGLVGFVAPLGGSASVRRDGQPAALVIGSGVASLAAGVAWLIWARGR